VFLEPGERHLRAVVREFVEHYHAERNHQGLGNVIPFPSRDSASPVGRIGRRERLGASSSRDATRRGAAAERADSGGRSRTILADGRLPRHGLKRDRVDPLVRARVLKPERHPQPGCSRR
jgi:hypothetical protein